MNQMLRNTATLIFQFACEIGVESCISDSRRMFDEWKEHDKN